MAKVLLIQPSSIRNRKEAEVNVSMPLGLVNVGSSLEMHGHKVKILDRALHPLNEELKEILKENWDFVGLSSFTNPSLYDAIDVSKFIKENSNSIVVWGGFHVMSLPEVTLKNPYVDYIIRGESEETFPKILELYEKGKDFSKLRGVNLNPPALPPDLDKIPIPNYNLLELDKYADFSISTSRGCPYRCNFCYNGYGDNKIMKPYRPLDFDKTIQLIKDVVYKYKRNVFTIIDDNFPSDKQRMKKICDEISKLGVNFNAFCRANNADEETLTYLKKSGCWQVDIGVESGSDRILELLNKGTTAEINKKAIRNCKKVGIMCNCLIMLGMPTETLEDVKMTEDLIKEVRPQNGGSSIFYLLPKTKMWDFCKEKWGLEEPKTLEEWADLFPMNWCEPKTNFSEMSNKEIKDYQVKLDKLLTKWKYFKKIKLYIKNGRRPSYRRVLGVLREKMKLKEK
jgi:anaerobic magnesium-protoporphyrin IX monomethyl ester cyclase